MGRFQDGLVSWTIHPIINILRINLYSYKTRHNCMSPTLPLSSLLRCARCSYEWIPRKDQLPKRCPKCRSINGMTPTSGSHAFAAVTRGTPITGHRRDARHAGHTSGTYRLAVTPASVVATVGTPRGPRSPESALCARRRTGQARGRRNQGGRRPRYTRSTPPWRDS